MSGVEYYVALILNWHDTWGKMLVIKIHFSHSISSLKGLPNDQPLTIYQQHPWLPAPWARARVSICTSRVLDSPYLLCDSADSSDSLLNKLNLSKSGCFCFCLPTLPCISDSEGHLCVPAPIQNDPHWDRFTSSFWSCIWHETTLVTPFSSGYSWFLNTFSKGRGTHKAWW